MRIRRITAEKYNRASLNLDSRILFAARFTRLFAYGSLSVVLVFYLTSVGLTEAVVGVLLTLVLVGDTGVSLYLTTRADRIGRRRTLLVGAFLMAAAGLAFALTSNPLLLMLAGTIGVISPSGNEVGPFLPIEQAALSQVVPARNRTEVFAWYALTGSIATAVGSLTAGWITGALQTTAMQPVSTYRVIVAGYAAMGLALGVLFARLSPAAESRGQTASSSEVSRWSGLGESRRVVAKLSALFALDSFGGGFVVQSFAAYWFHLRFGADPRTLGVIFFGANILAGFSALVASRLAARIGLVNTMVATHLPSNVLLILVPLMPNLTAASLVLLARFSISQMDVPARQSYVMAVVHPDERSAAAGITGVARTVGAAISPSIVGLMLARPALINLPFFLAGMLKIVYDLLLYRGFAAIGPMAEQEIDAENRRRRLPYK
jgi:MFS family permease